MFLEEIIGKHAWADYKMGLEDEFMVEEALRTLGKTFSQEQIPDVLRILVRENYKAKHILGQANEYIACLEDICVECSQP